MEADPILRRVGWTAVVICAALIVAALVLARGRLLPALAVAAGGLLSLVSYRLIVAGAGGLAASLAPGPERPAGPAAGASEPLQPRRRSAALAAVGVAGRYALLALLAYVMIARLRLPPLGLLAGASSVVAAVSLEAIRFLSKKTP